MKKSTILYAAQITRSMTRISHEILERNKETDGLVFLGAIRRGELLADRLHKSDEDIVVGTIPTGTMDITAYRDDKEPDTDALEDAMDIDVLLDGRHVIIVDDVLYTGRTIRAAMDAILNQVRPSKISLA